MNIVYGGSFNPPTIAHKAIVDELKRIFNPENLIIIPTGDSYNRKELIPFKYRKEMVLLSIPNVIVSDIENKNQEYKGTLYTLDLLSKDYNDIYFVMGADNIIDIKSWIRYEELLERYNFIILKRDDINIEDFINNELSKYKNHIHIVEFDYKISSSLIRKDINKYKYMLDETVYEYIKNNKLFEGK